MTANCNPQPSLQVYGEPINHVTDFKYLGSKMVSAASDLKRCKALAWSAFWKLERLFRGSQITISAKVKLFYTTCVTAFLYGCESWVLSLDMESKINAFATCCHLLLQDYAFDKTTKLHIQQCYLFHAPTLSLYVRKRQLGFLGHIFHLPEEEPARRYDCMYHLMAKGSRDVHTPLTSHTPNGC